MAEAGFPFSREILVEENTDEIIQRFVDAVAGTPGYSIGTAGPNSIVLTRRYRPTWAIILGVLGVLLLLIGALFFLVTKQETTTITARGELHGARVSVNGVASRDLIYRLVRVVPVPAPASMTTRKTFLGLGGAPSWTEGWVEDHEHRAGP